MNYLSNKLAMWWNWLSPNEQYQVKSGWHTFASAFIMAFLAQLQMTGWALPNTKVALFALFSVAVRAGIKALGGLFYNPGPQP